MSYKAVCSTAPATPAYFWVKTQQIYPSMNNIFYRSSEAVAVLQTAVLSISYLDCDDAMESAGVANRWMLKWVELQR